MKLQILSDLHLEQTHFSPSESDADVVILAGDIGRYDEGIYWARDQWPEKEIIFVAGNHELYGGQREDRMREMKRIAVECNVHMLENDEVVINGVRFLGTMLWTDFKVFGDDKLNASMVEAQRRLNDFRLIREGNERFSPARSIKLHEQSLAWLKAKLDEPFDGMTIVVTHHLPSMTSVASNYKEDLLTACFASQLDYLFGRMDLWVHGHTHSSSDYEVNGTRVICNPRGYDRYTGIENTDFNPSLIIDVPTEKIKVAPR